MNLLEEYRRRGAIPTDAEILVDEKDEFSIIYMNKRGEPIIMGVNRCSFDFWRNKKHESL